MKLTLNSWAKKQFETPPKITTLRKWAKSGLIQPRAIKIGRDWMVDQNAKYAPEMKLAYDDICLSDLFEELFEEGDSDV